MRASLSCYACSERTIGNGLKLGQRRFRLDIRKTVFHCSGSQALKQVVQGGGGAPETFKSGLDLALCDGLVV